MTPQPLSPILNAMFGIVSINDTPRFAMKPTTIRTLKESGYPDYTVRQEIRRNTLAKLKAGEKIFSHIIGYDDTVIPHILNAILAGHDIMFLGERGQAKTRLMRSLVNVLDDEIPVIKGCEINDHPYRPVCRRCKDLVKEMGDLVPIIWKPRQERYIEKLATPDVSMADLIGEVDPIKVAEGRYLADELTIHFGLIPRSNRGIFAINELPDLAEKIQVGLFNLMEERDIQIRGFNLRLPLEVCLAASANPEDYTNRGRIVTPLKDRFGSEVRTHYPATLDDEITIVDQEHRIFSPDGFTITTPRFMKEIIAAISHEARRHPEIDQRSGVSVRMTIANYETVVSNALKRTLRQKETAVIPRITDLAAAFPSSLGKIEWFGLEERQEERIFVNIIKEAVRKVFTIRCSEADMERSLKDFDSVRQIRISEMMAPSEYTEQVGSIPSLRALADQLVEDKTPASLASAIEFVLEGLHLKGKLHKEKIEGVDVYHG